MQTFRFGFRPHALTAAVCASASLTLPLALASAAGAAIGLGLGDGDDPAMHTLAEPLQAAAAMAEQGRLIQAKAMLDDLVRSGRVHSLSEQDRAESLRLLRRIDNQIRTADPDEISLQRAEWYVTTGEYGQSERHLNAVAGKPGLSRAMRLRADQLIETLRSRRAELVPLVPELILQAETDFQSGRFAASKTAIASVLRSGVELTESQKATLEHYQIKILEIEAEQGRAFDITQGGVSLSVMQPGTVRRGSSQPSAPPEEPREQPASNEPESIDLVGSQPAPSGSSAVTIEDLSTGERREVESRPAAAQPEPTPPAPQPSVAPPISDGDLIQAAMRADAQAMLVQATAAYEAARYREAVEKFSLCVGPMRQYLSVEEVARAERGLADARVRLNQPGAGDFSQEIVRSQEQVRQQVQAEFRTIMSEANKALEAGDTARATEQVARARLVVSGGRGSFTEGEYENFLREIDELNGKIRTRDRELNEQARQREERERITRQQQLEEQRALERDRKINENIDRIRALQAERKYRDALKVVEDVLFLDPNNPTALLLKDILRDIIIYDEYNRIQQDKFWGHAQLRLDAEETMIPTREIMDFPDNWPNKTVMRGEQSAFVDTAENRRVLAQVSNTRLPADFSGNRLEDVITFVQTVTQLPIDTDWDSLSQIGVDRDTQVSLRLSPMPLNVLLDRILFKVSSDPFQKAAWTVNQGVLEISSDEALRRNRLLLIYNIQDLLFDIPNYTEVPEIDLNSVLQQGGGGQGQSPFQGTGGGGPGTEPRPTREERTRRIIDIIQANVDQNGWVDNGGETGTLQELNGSLIITNTPANHREIVGLLSKLREIRNMQINVETKFLLVNQNWFEQIGFDLDIVINANNNQVRTARGTDPNIQPGDFFDFSDRGASGGNRGLQRTITSGTPGATAQGVVNPAGWSPVSGQQNSLGLANSLAVGDFASAVLAQAPALGIAGQFLDDIQVDFLIQATQADQRTVQLTAPRLTFTNGQIANIFVVTQQAFVSDLEPVVGDSAVGFDPDVSVASEGVTLLVEGVISADRRYVTMNVDAGVARIDGFAREQVTAVAGGQLVNSADTGSFIQLPTITVTRVRTTVTVPDEGTILLGGQRLITELEVETGVPVLSKIPVLNRFFTNRIESKEEQTLLILMKPTILIQSEQEERAYPGLQDSVRSGLNFLR
ncbi:MAG: hypothetical protein KF768_10020 [Phycisphaeraceae bacterium]|nr:hypothetical protein [Phycisphaeraceae bacterium]